MGLSGYAGETVEIYISYASDYAGQDLGVFVDDIEISGQPLEDFESGMGEWTVSVAPGSFAFNNWRRMTSTGFPESPAIRTADSVYLGFGFEAIDTFENRRAVMERVMQYLLSKSDYRYLGIKRSWIELLGELKQYKTRNERQ